MVSLRGSGHFDLFERTRQWWVNLLTTAGTLAMNHRACLSCGSLFWIITLQPGGRWHGSRICMYPSPLERLPSSISISIIHPPTPCALCHTSRRELFTAVQHFSRVERLPTWQQLELNVFRTAAAYCLDLLRADVSRVYYSLSQRWQASTAFDGPH
jgi:hypothetical protein